MSIITAIRKTQGYWLFVRREDETSLVAVIKWWELRRIPYNFIVGVFGVLTCIISILVAAITSKILDEPLGLPDPPILDVIAIIFFALMANICYTGGWVVELVVRAIWEEKVGHFAQITFTLGLLFSAVVTLAPAVLFTALLVIRLILS